MVQDVHSNSINSMVKALTKRGLLRANSGNLSTTEKGIEMWTKVEKQPEPES